MSWGAAGEQSLSQLSSTLRVGLPRVASSLWAADKALTQLCCTRSWKHLVSGSFVLSQGNYLVPVIYSPNSG